jgi:hypothetical protein
VNQKKQFLIELFNLLNQKYNYAVLRSYDGLPDNFQSHDIDIIFDKNQYTNFKKDFKNLLDSNNLNLILHNKGERFDTFILASYENNTTTFLYLNFFFNYSLYGIKLLDSKEILKNKIFNEKIEVVTNAQNPIRELKKEKDMLQLLPLKEQMFKKKFLFKFLYTNSDFIAFNSNKYNQLLIPIVEE